MKIVSYGLLLPRTAFIGGNFSVSEMGHQFFYRGCFASLLPVSLAASFLNGGRWSRTVAFDRRNPVPILWINLWVRTEVKT
jgi:hypothetical protein